MSQKNVSWKNAKVDSVLENSGYLLKHGHWDFQNWRRINWENEAQIWQPPQKMYNSLFTLCIPLLFYSLVLNLNAPKNWKDDKWINIVCSEFHLFVEGGCQL